jgi:peptide-methionine (S)-S-oxide reductase
MTEQATFAAGCFWGVEEAFAKIPGVLTTAVGYTGGHTQNPTYKEVCAGNTGHAEAVVLTYNPDKVSYDKLLQAFWTMHDPTTLNRQGPDIGSQYRSAIFTHTPSQQQAAMASKAALKLNKPVVTEVTDAVPFYMAEDYHQKYFEKHGMSCHL